MPEDDDDGGDDEGLDLETADLKKMLKKGETFYPQGAAKAAPKKSKSSP